MDKVIKSIMTIAMIVAMVAVIQGCVPQPQYTCPICGQKFMTYDELYSHFTTEHPAEPITIIWE